MAQTAAAAGLRVAFILMAPECEASQIPNLQGPTVLAAKQEDPFQRFFSVSRSLVSKKHGRHFIFENPRW